MEHTIPSKNTKTKLLTCPAEIRIGTRGSQLAVAQANEVKNRLLGAFSELTQSQIKIIKIVTTGDRIQDRHLAEIGGKGLFTKEIEEALHAGDIDMAVHSMKDMPDRYPEGLTIDCILEREDPRDAFISNKASNIMALPEGATIGTSSIRRQSQLLRARPDLKIVQFRGNINTRLKKLDQGDVDATLLAAAGLKRTDQQDRITSLIEPELMLPAVAQGAIGVECLSDNEHILQVLSTIDHPPSNIRVSAERGFLKALNGSCTTPLGALAEFRDNQLYFRGLLASPDGRIVKQVERLGSPTDAEAIGTDAGEEMLAIAGELLPA